MYLETLNTCAGSIMKSTCDCDDEILQYNANWRTDDKHFFALVMEIVNEIKAESMK